MLRVSGEQISPGGCFQTSPTKADEGDGVCVCIYKNESTVQDWEQIQLPRMQSMIKYKISKILLISKKSYASCMVDLKFCWKSFWS